MKVSKRNPRDLKVTIKKITAALLFVPLAIAVGFWIDSCFTERDVWSIGIYMGTAPYEFFPAPSILNNPVLKASTVTDVPARFVADPFMVRSNNTWNMFFEVLNDTSNHGDIGLASSNDGIHWQYHRIVLDEPFHLSYPYVFKYGASYYMIPESRRAYGIRLYKAVDFPVKWIFLKELVAGNFSDPSIAYKDGLWWLMVLKDLDTLVLYYTHELTGPWVEHPSSPIVSDDMNISRPAGRILVLGDRMIRYAQDCDPVYGREVVGFEIDEITTMSYKEHRVRVSPVITATGSGWNAAGMHHIDPHLLNEKSWIACVDGKRKKRVFDWKIGTRKFIDMIISPVRMAAELLKQ